MENFTTKIKKKRHTRIRVSSTERLIVWRKERNETDIALECPHCGAKVFWLEVNRENCEVQYEYEDTDN
ncbi:MAG TPA: hypothetical protein PKY59_22420 [Pyrinomonadaceae bacterium]|nr:hypothetical protein [Pyrinomonadaceae bacterium]